MDSAVAHVALGSNVGDRRAAIQGALEAIAQLPCTAIERTSTLIETKPVGPDAAAGKQGQYLNGVVRLRTSLDPRRLMDHLLEVEHSLGRRRRRRWAARTIDLDIILWGDLVMDEPGLTIPHPRMHERRFVLEPLAEIDPDVVVPTFGRTSANLLRALKHE